jgi:hypothetical protein
MLKETFKGSLKWLSESKTKPEQDLHKAIFHDTASPSPPGYFKSPALVIKYTYFTLDHLIIVHKGSNFRIVDEGLA